MVLAWENLWRFLWCWSSFCCCYSSFIVFLHSHFLFNIIPHPSVDYHQVFRPILYPFQSSPSQSYSRHFHFQPFRYLLTTSATVLSGHFLLTGVFYLMFLPNILAQPAFIKVSLGAGSYPSKFAGLHTDPWNINLTHLFVWFTEIHNLLYILNLYLYMSILQNFLLAVKTLIKNIVQQPHYSAAMKI